ncbi:MAG: B12-binding domain-containing radical SAM protein [Fusobacteriia bacterium 4572_132]|nr:MAG: B12-binding domain-containing radical SAM protein [Fusobacteriia bacterium 4572_132]
MSKIDKYLLQVNKPTQYLGNELNSIYKKEYETHICFIYPDLYEVGMSSLATQILYYGFNQEEGVYCERGFAPEVDMEEILRKNKIPLFSLETKTDLKDFDLLTFTLSYEMTYTNILNILDMAQLNIEREKRKEEDPIIMAGGTGAYNPKIMQKYIDVFVVGEGEEVLKEICSIMRANKNKSKDEKLIELSKIKGLYVSKFYNGEKIQKRIVKDLDKNYYPDKWIVPYMKVIHNRTSIEIQRGCTRGCRFCQAGMVYRPVRERSVEKNMLAIKNCLNSTGYDEVSLSSLSTSDYSQVGELISEVKKEYEGEKIAISLPSLRMDNFSLELAKKVSEGRKTGFTFAPEAGSQRVRDIINKGVTEEDIMSTAIGACKSGWRRLKFYFMIGLPFETLEDVEAIHTLTKKVLRDCIKVQKGIEITVSVSNFVPKNNTPFQWEKQMNMEEMKEKHNLLRKLFAKEKRLNIKIHNPKISYLEGFLSRGDERIGELVKKAWEKGAKFDGWKDHFKFDKWIEALEELEIKEEDYLGKREINKELPWEIIDSGIKKEFLISELDRAKELALTQDCREGCTGCGICQHYNVDMDIKK